MMPCSNADSISSSSSSSSSSINEQIDQIPTFTPPSSDTVGNGTASPKKKPKIRASILEYKTVNQMYDPSLFVTLSEYNVDLSCATDGTERTMVSNLWNPSTRSSTEKITMRSTFSSNDVNMVCPRSVMLTSIFANLKIDEANMHYKTFVDIKSEALRDVLREVLEGVNTVSLRGDKPEVRIFFD